MAVPQPRLDQIRDLVNQWEQLVGYMIPVSDEMIDLMATGTTPAGNKVNSLFDVGAMMASRGTTFSGMPWARYGMNVSEWSSKFDVFGTAFSSLTGQAPDMGMFEEMINKLHGQGGEGEFRTLIANDPHIRETYGWVRFGLDWAGFQQQKEQMRMMLGVNGEVDDRQAVLQLQYTHRNQGGNSEVVAQPIATPDQKKQATFGTAQSEVR